MKIQVLQATPEQRRLRPEPGAKLPFGRYFTDHMFLADYDPEQGWQSPRIEPYHNLSLSPANLSLHYAQLIFEGMKAYKNDKGEIYLFRWRKNLERFNRSAERLCMPPVDAGLFGEALQELVLLDQDWIPQEKGSSLYLRPVMIATDNAIGVRPSETYLFYIIASPAGPYNTKGFVPVQMWVSDTDVRAVLGGTGEAKCAGNYAAGLRAQKEAKAKGFDHVLWLDARERKYIEEVGTMNIFFLLNGTLVTPPLRGAILPGITRDSVLQIAKAWNIPVEERRITIDEVFQAIESKELTECFGTGTAAVISPVSCLSYKGRKLEIGNGAAGALSTRFFDYLLDLQRGLIPDPFGWVEQINPGKTGA